MFAIAFAFTNRLRLGVLDDQLRLVASAFARIPCGGHLIETVHMIEIKPKLCPVDGSNVAYVERIQGRFHPVVSLHAGKGALLCHVIVRLRRVEVGAFELRAIVEVAFGDIGNARAKVIETLINEACFKRSLASSTGAPEPSELVLNERNPSRSMASPCPAWMPATLSLATGV